MLVRFFLHVLAFVLVVLTLLGMFVCFGCGAGDADTSVGRFRSIESKIVYTIHDYRIDVVFADWNAKRVGIINAWLDGKIDYSTKQYLHSSILEDRNRLIQLIRHDRRYAKRR